MKFFHFKKILKIFFLVGLLAAYPTFATPSFDPSVLSPAQIPTPKINTATLSKNSSKYCTQSCANFQSTTSNTEKSKSGTPSQSLNAHCAAFNLVKKTQDYEIATISLYSIASISCLTACALLSTGIGAFLAFSFETSCAITDSSAIGTDIANMINLQNEGEKDTQGLIETSTLGSTAVGLSAARLAARIAPNALKTIGTSTLGDLLPCLGGSALAALAIMKGKSLRATQDQEIQECNSIKNLCGSMNCNTASLIPTPSTAPSSSLFNGGNLKNPGSSANALGTSINSFQATPQSSSSPSASLPNIFNSVAATAEKNPLTDPFSNMLKNIANTQKTPLQAISNALQNGSNLQEAVLSGYPKLPEEVQNAMKKIEDLVKNKDLSLVGFNSHGNYTGSASSSSKNSLTPTINFEIHEATTKTLNFQRASLPTIEVPNSTEISDPDTTDIWHTNESETIFKIISRRLRLSQENLEKLPWQNSYNRKNTESLK